MGAHALLAPSSAKRWMTCAPSARLEASVPEKETVFTREGTIAHAMAEAILRDMLANKVEIFPEPGEYLTSRSGIILAEFCRTCDREGFDWREMAETVYDHYVRPVYESYLGAKLQDPEAELLIEAKLKLSEFIPEGFGSSDAVLIYKDTMEVFDLKYGKGVKVEADNNPQMMCYALGAYCGPGEFYDINTVRMTIIQPRLQHESSFQICVVDLLFWAEHVLKPAAQAAFKGEGTQIPGDHCRFCKVAARCKALAAHTLEVTKEKHEPGLMTMEEIAQLLPHFETIKNWIGSVEDYALNQALNGETVPGYKVVEGTSRRKIEDTATAIKKLKEAGIPEDSYMKPRELKNISDLEKALTKKGFNAILGPQVIKPQGKPTLVENADPRKPYSKAADDFKELL